MSEHDNSDDRADWTRTYAFFMWENRTGTAWWDDVSNWQEAERAHSAPPHEAEAHRRYVLDTSAVRSLAGKELSQASAIASLSMSPVSFWELVCHLDEAVKKDTPERSYLRQRGQVLKCKTLQLLDDPYAFHASKIGAPQVVNTARFDDRYVIPQVLQHLEAVQDIDALYSCTVTYPSGDVARVHDIAANARRVLDAEEKNYEAHVRGLGALLEKEIGPATLRSLTNAEFAYLASISVPGLARDYQAKVASDPQLVGRVLASLYAALGYKLARAKAALLKSGASATMSIDPNDMEDGEICLHLDLTDELALVTGDDGTVAALTEAFKAIDSALPGVRRCRVLGLDAFKKDLLR
ncbi:hypothetical protein WME88_35660 [Sorangium sp. So ce216]